MSCAGVIKQTSNYSFWTIQYTCFVVSRAMSSLCLQFRPKVAWTDGTNLSLIDEVAMIKWVTWESYISQTSLVTYVFYCTFQLTIMWRTIEKSLKKILRQLLLLRNHLNIRSWMRIDKGSKSKLSFPAGRPRADNQGPFTSRRMHKF